MTTTQKSSGTCPCCCDTAPLQQTANELPPNEIASDTQLCGGDAIKRLEKKPIDALRALTEAPELLDTAAATFAMTQTHKLTKSALGLWNLHKEVIDDTLEGGWDNPTHGWNRSVQNFWKYPTFFGIYAIPSLVMICPEMLDEAAEYMRKSILLSRDTPVWDGWIRQGFSDNPICRRNIMYKGHVVLACGLYQLMSGRTEFEETLKEVMDVIVKEYIYNSHCETPFMAIECEPDQVFAPCNSQSILALLVYDKLYGTHYYQQFGEPSLRFLQTKVSDPQTHLFLQKYHPSHDQGEPYCAGAYNAWPMAQLYSIDPEYFAQVFPIFKEKFAGELFGGKVWYLKEYADDEEPTSTFEESTGIFYTLGLCKEAHDFQSWEKFYRYFIGAYGLKMDGDTMRMTTASMADESYVHNYLLWGQVHQGWANIINYNWAALRK